MSRRLECCWTGSLPWLPECASARLDNASQLPRALLAMYMCSARYLGAACVSCQLHVSASLGPVLVMSVFGAAARPGNIRLWAIYMRSEACQHGSLNIGDTEQAQASAKAVLGSGSSVQALLACQKYRQQLACVPPACLRRQQSLAGHLVARC